MVEHDALHTGFSHVLGNGYAYFSVVRRQNALNP